MPEQFPWVGQTHAHCPHCHEFKEFDEYTLFVGPNGKFPLLLDHEGKERHSALQVCRGCHRKIVLIDDQMVYPYRLLPSVSLRFLPSHLSALVFSSYQLIESLPAQSAAALRRALEQLCVHHGWDGRTPANYVDYLAVRLSNHAHIAVLRKYCLNGQEPIPTSQIRWEDDEECVNSLCVVLDVAAKKLDEATKKLDEQDL